MTSALTSASCSRNDGQSVLALDEFVECFSPENRFDRVPTWPEENPQERWLDFSYEELIQRDKTSLDIFGVPNDILNDSIGEPDVIATIMFQDLQIAMERISLIMDDLKQSTSSS